MSSAFTAQDLWPLVQKLPREEQVRLADLVMMSASRERDASGQARPATPPTPEELSGDDDPLAWEADGWAAPNRVR